MDDRELFQDAGYLLEEPLEADEWGGLYNGLYVPHNRKVLLRVFPPALASEPGAWELMQAEIQAWARLEHPGVLQVLDWGEIPGRCYVATAMPRGEPLAALLAEDIGVDGADELFASLLVSVEAARQWGVLHLGLGPSNIWVDGGGGVEVGEFGFWYVAREFPGLEVDAGRFKAPEQLNSERASAATDVYSLGLIYVALRGGMGASLDAARGSGLPFGLADSRAVLERCLERQPLVRYRSARELADTLGLRPEEWLYEEYRDCPICRLKKEIQRGASSRSWTIPAVVGSTDAVWVKYIWAAIVALAVGTALVWWLALR